MYQCTKFRTIASLSYSEFTIHCFVLALKRIVDHTVLTKEYRLCMLNAPGKVWRSLNSVSAKYDGTFRIRSKGVQMLSGIQGRPDVQNMMLSRRAMLRAL